MPPIESGPPGTSGDQELVAIVNKYGGFIQNFAILELVVVAWLWKCESDEQQAKLFLEKTRQFDARVRRLQSLLRTEGSPQGIAVAGHLHHIAGLRDFRNDIVHAPISVSHKGDIALVGWRGAVSISLSALEAKVKEAQTLLALLEEAYRERYGSIISLETTARAGPPPID